jgi:glycosyltransferase involved in cell wall biosynthesis
MKEYAGKILIIVQNLPVPFDRRVWLEAQTLTAHDYKVSVICPKSEDYNKSYEVTENVHIYRYNMPINANGVLSYFLEFAYAWLATAFLSIKVLLRQGFDVIQACNPPDTYFLLGWIYKLFGKKYVFDHHDLCPEMFAIKYASPHPFLHKALLLLEKLTMHTANIVIVTNKSYKEMAMKRGDKNSNDIYIVRTGPDLRRLQPCAPQRHLKEGFRYLVCYLGEMCPQDGVDYLLKSADYLVNTLGHKDILFVLLGGGPAMPMFKEMSEKMGLQKNVRFTGRVSDELLSCYLSTADVCVDPDPWSEWATCSTMNKVLEYMAFARPVVAFDLKETRRSAMAAAEYVQPNEIDKFAEKIVDLLNDPEKRRLMGYFGQQRIRQSLAWEHSQTNLLAAYERVFADKISVTEPLAEPQFSQLAIADIVNSVLPLPPVEWLPELMAYSQVESSNLQLESVSQIEEPEKEAVEI